MPEGGTNICSSNVAEKGTNARPGVPLEGGYACGTAPNRFARVNEYVVEPTTIAEGDLCAGASTAAACGTNASPGIPLEGGYASRTTPDSFMNIRKRVPH